MKCQKLSPSSQLPKSALTTRVVKLARTAQSNNQVVPVLPIGQANVELSKPLAKVG